MTKYISILVLPVVLLLASFFIYGGCHNSNGNNIGNVVSNSDNDFTPVVASIFAPPVPVRGSDGRSHLTYEINLSYNIIRRG